MLLQGSRTTTDRGDAQTAWPAGVAASVAGFIASSRYGHQLKGAKPGCPANPESGIRVESGRDMTNT